VKIDKKDPESTYKAGRILAANIFKEKEIELNFWK
jgi:hypothetical protein